MISPKEKAKELFENGQNLVLKKYVTFKNLCTMHV